MGAYGFRRGLGHGFCELAHEERSEGLRSLATCRYDGQSGWDSQAIEAPKFGAARSNVLSLEVVFARVASVGDIPEGEGRPFELEGRMVVVFHHGGMYYAMDDCCPHQGAPLSDGILCDKTVTCSWHGWRFSLEDGRWLDSPRTQVPTYPVRVVDNQIEVAVTP